MTAKGTFPGVVALFNELPGLKTLGHDIYGTFAPLTFEFDGVKPLDLALLRRSYQTFGDDDSSWDEQIYILNEEGYELTTVGMRRVQKPLWKAFFAAFRSKPTYDVECIRETVNQALSRISDEAFAAVRYLLTFANGNFTLYVVPKEISLGNWMAWVRAHPKEADVKNPVPSPDPLLEFEREVQEARKEIKEKIQ